MGVEGEIRSADKIEALRAEADTIASAVVKAERTAFKTHSAE